MTVYYAATFEFDQSRPITHRGVVAASSMPTCFARAARDAVKAYRSRLDTNDRAAEHRRDVCSVD
jgi:hypothetical protein